MNLTDKQISDIISLIRSSGKEILRIYHSDDFNTRIKDDNSPVTRADLASDKIIKSGLEQISPGIPVYSEETKETAYSVRSEWEKLWILDPLDGTKEFIARNDEFCISLALIINRIPAAGFIHAPVLNTTWYAIRDYGAWRLNNGEKQRLPFTETTGPYRINISRSHHSAAEKSWIENFMKKHPAVTEITGSAIKFCRIAGGSSDIYPKFSLIHEWDIAAGDLIIGESGGKLIETGTGKPPLYNKEDYHQPPFIAFGRRSLRLNIADQIA